MFKVGIILVALLAFGYTTPAQAVKPDGDSAVSKTFKQLGRSMRGMRNVKDSEGLLVLLTDMRELAVKNRENVPSFMQPETDAYGEFQAGMDDFIARIDAAIEAAESDDFDGAMKLMRDIRGAKSEYHEKFELEESN